MNNVKYKEWILISGYSWCVTQCSWFISFLESADHWGSRVCSPEKMGEFCSRRRGRPLSPSWMSPWKYKMSREHWYQCYYWPHVAARGLQGHVWAVLEGGLVTGQDGLLTHNPPTPHRLQGSWTPSPSSSRHRDDHWLPDSENIRQFRSLSCTVASPRFSRRMQ